MMTRTTTATLLIFTLLLAAYITLIDDQVSTPATVEHTSRQLISTAAEDIDRITIQNGELIATAVRTGKGWDLTAPLKTGAFAAKIDDILDSLSTYTQGEVITQEEQHDRLLTLEQFELEPARATITLHHPLGETELLIGAQAPLTDRLYVKFRNRPEIIVTTAALLDSLPSTLDDIRDRALFSGPITEIDHFSLRRPSGGSYVLSKRKAQWFIDQPFAARADNDRVNGLLDRILTHRVHAFVWDPSEEPDPKATESPWQESDDTTARVTIAFGDHRQSLMLGRPESDTLVMAKLEGEKSVYTVSSILMHLFSLRINSLRDSHVFATEIADVQSVTIHEAGHRLSIARETSGWIITEPIKHKASIEAADSLLKKLIGLTAESFEDHPNTNLVSYGLVNPLLTFEILPTATQPLTTTTTNTPPVPQDTRTEKLLIGSPARNAEHVYAKFATSDYVMEISAASIKTILPNTRTAGTTLHFANPVNYRDKTVIALPSAKVKSLTLSKHSAFQSVRRSDTQWVSTAPPHILPHTDSIAAILKAVNSLSALRLQTFDPNNIAAYGITDDSPTLTLGLSGESGIQLSIILGFKSKTDGVYAMIQGQDVLFVIDAKVADTLMRDLVL